MQAAGMDVEEIGSNNSEKPKHVRVASVPSLGTVEENDNEEEAAENWEDVKGKGGGQEKVKEEEVMETVEEEEEEMGKGKLSEEIAKVFAEVGGPKELTEVEK